ncbi:energy transducer TonB [Imhoffiella purpurea]|uniref:Putative TonB protein n=1 Tax=Imhoffiella purpurea TaxID=1249627 RepID=W9W069_9GAMM|nr:energy transducer TonB [Imhoffiella purpurea]EXJ16030.1 Putative TonB protein [Imhoffiella purpurea]
MDSPTGDTERLPSLLIQSRPRRSPAFALALIGAGLLHLVALLTLGIEPPEPPPIPETAMEVLILGESGYASDEAAPDAALAQRTRRGASPDGDAARSSAEEESPDRDQETEEMPPEPDPPDTRVVEPPPAPDPEPVPVREEPAEILAAEQGPADLPATPPRIDAASILASRGREIDRLTASLEARSSAYAKRVRRKSISASTREFRYASYLGAWARKVERIGNLNYPQAAREAHLYGSLILHVAIRSDGSVENIRVVRSSGYPLLDDAAIQIVQLAAPYAPFPDDIAAETDVLDIIRTWQFMRGDVLGWER